MRAASLLRFYLLPLMLGLSLSFAGAVNAAPKEGLSFSIIITGESSGSLEAMVVDGGSWTTKRKLVHTAVLVQHPGGAFLWDTGLGTQLEEQLQAFNWWQKSLFKVENVNPAIAQLRAQQFDPSRLNAIIPSHMHWDHVSALEDFGDTPVWVQKAEHDEALNGAPPAFIASQFDAERINWQHVELANEPYMTFDKSLDIFGDGSAVLVDLSGHTAGQLGLFLTRASGERYFFIGDTAWVEIGVSRNRGRPVFVDWLVGVDSEIDRNAEQLSKIHALKKQHPELVIVPAHDELINRSLPIYPEFM